MKYFFICSIGPVQDFISTARRSRDLWYGSWMLSELSKAVANSLGKENLIFPSNTTDISFGGQTNLSNKIVAIIDSDTPETVGKKAKADSMKYLFSLRDEAFKKIFNKKGELDTEEMAKEQVANLLEFYWVAVPFPDEKKYSQTLKKAEALLSARKITRDFKQNKGSERYKSSLDGKRESVIPSEKYPQVKDNKKEIERKARVLYREYHARPGERLSGVDLMKRLGEPKDKGFTPSFHSTSHYASLPFQKMLKRKLPEGDDKRFLNDIRTAYNDWIGGDIPKYDGSLFYESRITDFIPAGERQEALKIEVAEIYKKYGISQRPSPYYALLRADGDNMGKIIDNQKNKESHRDLSEKLSKFSLKVKDIVKKHEGEVIYAGGDDILAYLPLHTVLNCVKALDDTFQKAMGEFIAKDRTKPSLSAGVVIAHHLTPLADVMEMSRDAEKRAKEVEGKNALVLLSSKRSGEDRRVLGKISLLTERLDKMITFHRQMAISKGTAYELQTLHHMLSNADISQEAIHKEALRIIKRKHESGSDKKIQQRTLDQFEAWLNQKSGLSLGNLAVEIIIASTFASALNVAEGKQEKQEEKK